MIFESLVQPLLTTMHGQHPPAHRKYRSAMMLALLALAALLAPQSALAQTMPMITSTTANGSTTYSLTIQTLLTMTAFTFIPAALLMMTSFTRIIIVFSLLRTALGTQNAPPTQILIGMSLFLTFFIMSPVLDRVYQEAYLPLNNNTIAFNEALDKASVPIKEFMLQQVREPDLVLFTELAKVDATDPAALPLRVIVPAFMTSELKTAFQIGFIVFIPFLIIDMVVASILMSMGMMMMSPVIVSLPFKIMLFVLVDGWTLLVGSLVNSFTV